MRESIKDILIRRDALTDGEADDLIVEAKKALHYYLDQGRMNDAENVCEEFFGLEPDYIDKLI